MRRPLTFAEVASDAAKAAKGTAETAKDRVAETDAPKAVKDTAETAKDKTAEATGQLPAIEMIVHLNYICYKLGANCKDFDCSERTMAWCKNLLSTRL